MIFIKKVSNQVVRVRLGDAGMWWYVRSQLCRQGLFMISSEYDFLVLATEFCFHLIYTVRKEAQSTPFMLKAGEGRRFSYI